MTQFANVTAVAKANVYFDGKVISHTILMPDGSKKTLGLIYPGDYKFNTGLPEKMEMIADACRVKLAGQSEWKTYKENENFIVPGNSYFEIGVDAGIAEYVCTFMQ